MAKSGRHKKIRKQEKAKTQLKSGIRKLDKPQNIIDPKLRVKKILLREQLKDNVEGEVATRRHQSLQDILTSLNHHNTNIKKDGLNGLQEIISSSVETLYDNLDRILEKIAGLTSDIEDSVRKENLRVAEIIFAQVSEDQVKPFWNLILTHIKCTLTNLSPIIRYGSLSFMSLLISYFPNLVSHSIQILLPNILGLISSSVVSTVSASKSPKNPASTTTPDKKNKLKIEISGKHNDAKERLRVLSLISACLDLYTTKQSSSSKTASNSQEDNGTIRLVWRDDSSHLGLYSPHGYVESQSVSPCYGPEGLRSVINTTSLSLKQSGADTVFQGDGNRSFNVVGSSSDDNQGFWPQFLQSCLPLLFETWLEVRPSAEDEKRGNVKLEPAARGVNNLPRGTVEILECIVTVMTRLFIQGNLLGHNTWNCRHGDDGVRGEDTSHIRQLRKNQGQELRKYFFDSLPFSALLDSQKKTVTSVNLQLFSIAAQLRLVDKSLMLRLQQYLQVLISNSAMDSGQTSQVLEILSFIHLSNVGTLTSGVLSYALDSGHYEAVNGFLGRTLTLGQDSSAEQNLMLKTIEWDSIVPKIFERITSVTPTLLTVLTFIALRNLTDLKPVLESNLDKFDSFLDTTSSLGDWDQVARLFYFTGCLKSMKYFQVTIPEQVLETVQVLTA